MNRAINFVVWRVMLPAVAVVWCAGVLALVWMVMILAALTHAADSAARRGRSRPVDLRGVGLRGIGRRG